MAGRPRLARVSGGFPNTGTRAPGGNMNQNMLLQIWRKKKFNNYYYYKVKDIALPCNSDQLNLLRTCAMQQDCVEIYECTLILKMIVNVKAEDILGITLPPKDNVRFVLYFQNSTVSSHVCT